MKVNDAVTGGLLIVFAAVMARETLTFPELSGQDYSSALFPQIIAVLMGLCGLALVAKGVAARGTVPWVTVPEWVRSPGHVRNFAVLLVSMAFYVAASDALGFIPTAISVLVATMTALRGVRRIGSTLAISVAAALIMQQFFGGLLRVPLPYGIVPPNLF
jgi:putative tricarboxylic transport membrane protein